MGALMTTRDDSLSGTEIQEIIKGVLECLPSVEGIYIYGSMARGEGRPDSDVDIAVVQLEPVKPDQALILRSNLGVLLGRDIDILDLRRASTEIAYQVVGDGACVWGADNENVALYENSIMSMYANLQNERREIMEDIIKRGSVYGR